MIQAAIFDMDGLLIDSEPYWRKSHIGTLADHGYTITEDDVRAVAGSKTEDVVRRWYNRFRWENPSIKEMEIKIVTKVIDHIKTNGQALPGVRKIIDMFLSKNIPMAVASSSPPEVIEAVLARLNLAQYMRLAYSASGEEFGKPHPSVFLSTASKLGVRPKNCVVFEDSVNGVRAAKAANMKCIAVPEPLNRNKPEYKAADLVIESLEKVTWQDITSLWSL